MKETIEYVDRVGSNSNKWDNQEKMFGENGLLGMWVADMDFRAPACVREALHRYVDFGVFGYSSPSDAYAQAFIDWEKKQHGYAVKKEWLRFSPGVVPAFNWWLRICSEKGDAVIVLTPVYYPFLHAVKNNERCLITSELRCEGGHYTIDFEDFEQKITENDVKAFILCSPHNPVGRVWKREELARLLEICRRHHVFVISDEIHHDLTFSGAEHIPSATLGDYDDMLVTLTAPSKTFNLAGLQNALVIVPDETLRKKYDEFTQRIRILGGNTAGYIAAEAAYRGGEEWLSAVKEIIWGNFLYVRKTLAEKLPQVIIAPLEGTYLMWLDFGAYVRAEDMESFFQKKCRVAFDYGSWFGGNAPCCIRMNLACARETVEECLHRILAALQ